MTPPRDQPFSPLLALKARPISRRGLPEDHAAPRAASVATIGQRQFWNALSGLWDKYGHDLGRCPRLYQLALSGPPSASAIPCSITVEAPGNATLVAPTARQHTSLQGWERGQRTSKPRDINSPATWSSDRSPACPAPLAGCRVWGRIPGAAPRADARLTLVCGVTGHNRCGGSEGNPTVGLGIVSQSC